MPVSSNAWINSILGPSATGGYTVFNTIILTAVALFVFFVVFWPVVKKSRIKIGYSLVLGGILYLLFGSVIRVFEDIRLLPYSFNPLELGFYTHTPGLWAAIGVLALAMLLISNKLEEKRKGLFLKVFVGTGAVLLLISLALLLPHFSTPLIFLSTVILIGAVSGIGIFLARRFVKGFKNEKLNNLAVLGQAIDGCATFVGTTFLNCGEQHFVSKALLGFLPFGFVIAKILIAILLMHLIDQSIEDKNYRNYAKAFVIALGFMTGTRNLLILGIGGCGGG